MLNCFKSRIVMWGGFIPPLIFKKGCGRIARKCVCRVTKEYGTTDTFYKAEDNRYYKSKEIYDEIEPVIKQQMIDYINSLSESKELPIEVVNVVVDKAKPNDGVREELNNTAIYMQQRNTQVMKQEMEIARRETEHLRALADKEYQITMGFTPAQFIQLRALELENQKIEMIKNKSNVNVDVMLGNSTPMWDIKQK